MPKQIKPIKPAKPLARMIKEGTIGTCSICHSTERKFRFMWFSFRKGCINPDCQNYYKNKIKM